MKLIKLDAIDSTNSYMKELINYDKIEDYSVIISKHQTSGRGRNKNIWIDKPSMNLNFSMFKHLSNFKIKDKFFLNIITSISVYLLLKKYKIKNISIKWPNDIMAGNKKISGILIENTIRGKLIINSVLGIGININQLCFKNLPKATSIILETGVNNSIEIIAFELQKILIRNFKIYKKSPDKLLTNYNTHLFGKGKYSDCCLIGENKIQYEIIKVNSLGEILLNTIDGKTKNFREDEIKIYY